MRASTRRRVCHRVAFVGCGGHSLAMPPHAKCTKPGRWIVAILLVVFGVIVWPLVGAPYFGEDVFEVGKSYEEGLSRFLADCTGSRSGLSTQRVYRPVPSLAFYLQTCVSTDATWMRSVNIIVHALGVVMTAMIAKRLGAGVAMSVFAGLWIIAFRGGVNSWCWVVGRVDAFSFGFGMAGFYLYLFAEDGRAWLRRIAGCALLAASFLSKETGVVFGPALALFLVIQKGRRGIVEIVAPAVTLGSLFVLRWFALDGILGGYVGEMGGRSMAPLEPANIINVFALCAGLPGLPAGAVLLLMAAAACTFLWLHAVARRSRPDSARHVHWLFPAAALLVSLLFYLPPPVAAGGGVPGPQHARNFTIAFAWFGLAVSVAASAWLKGRVIPWIPALLLPLVPARVLWLDMLEVRNAARRIEATETRVRDFCRAAQPSPLPVLVPDLPSGWPPAAPIVPMFNFGISGRFAPPFDHDTKRRVWPLRPLFHKTGAPRLNITKGSLFAQLVCDMRELGGGDWIQIHQKPVPILPVPTMPPVLAGADAVAMQEGRHDVSLQFPTVPAAKWLQISLVTPVAGGIAKVGELQPSWKALWTAPLVNGEGLLYQLPGLSADYGATRLLIRFEWLDGFGERLAETDPVELATDAAFEQFVRAEADAVFGVRRRAPARTGDPGR